jgi:16S rRNA (guanine966-N2)-methyltransferase
MRITGGTHRSRTVVAPHGQSTRPTSDRVREALFSILGASFGELEGARVLDLFAGSGALAFEALSRGAAHATLVEKDRSALRAIRENAAALGMSPRVRVVAEPVERACQAGLAGLASPARDLGAFDVVFADPPYAVVDETARLLGGVAESLLAAEGVLVLEHSSKTAPPAIATLSLRDGRRYGDTALSFYVRG